MTIYLDTKNREWLFKYCTRCNILKPVIEFTWRKDKHTPRSDCKSCQRKYQKLKYGSTRSKVIEYKKQQINAITRKEYMQIYHRQKMEDLAGKTCPTKCDICDSPEKLVYDHDHTTNMFRGWVCYNCNIVLGLVADDQQHLYRLINYLSRKEI